MDLEVEVEELLTGLPAVVLSVVRRLTKEKVAVSIGVSSALDVGLDWEMKKGRLVRMD